MSFEPVSSPQERYWKAWMIQRGASNPAGIARSLVEACDEALGERASGTDGLGTDDLCNDLAIRLIVHQLAQICNIMEYDQDPGTYARDLALCRERSRHTI